MIYEDEVVVLLELEIPSLRISLQGDIQDEDAQKERLQELEALDEKWIHAIEHQKAYYARLKWDFGKKIKPKMFQVGDLVLK